MYNVGLSKHIYNLKFMSDVKISIFSSYPHVQRNRYYIAVGICIMPRKLKQDIYLDELIFVELKNQSRILKR